MFNFKIANARYINVHRARNYRSLAFRASCLCLWLTIEARRRAPFIGTSSSTRNGTILMHDESAILSTINPPFIFFLSVRREAR